MKTEMRNVKYPRKKINPYFQTRYHIIRNDNDIEEFLLDSERDVINRVGKFMKKVDTRKKFDNPQLNKKSVYESDDDLEAFNNPKSNKKKKVFMNQMMI